MGYYTKYSLKIIKVSVNDDQEKEMVKDLAKIMHGDDQTPAKYFDDLLEESMKWYSHEKDMKSFSKKYPGYIFLLEGEGEENGDLWREYFKNGKSHRIHAKVVFDEFNEGIFRDEVINEVLSK